jgi:hypothetical protein
VKITAALALALLTGCSTMFHGRYQDVAVASDPPGATVLVDCGEGASASGLTPTTARLYRGAAACSLTLQKQGHHDETLRFTRSIAPHFWWNVPAGLAVGAAFGTAAATSDPLCTYDCDTDSNGASLAGLALGTGVTMLVDRSTGAMYRQVPERVMLVLKPKS